MLTPAPHVRHAACEQGTALLDMRRGVWLMLDPQASLIWTAVTVRGDVTGLADETADLYGQDPRAVARQIACFVDELVDARVLVDTERPCRRRRWR
ncbi:PqqD family protein [Streptomyces griseoviridis]